MKTGVPGGTQAEPAAALGNGDGQGDDISVGQQQHQYEGDRFAPFAALLAPAGQPDDQGATFLGVGSAGGFDPPFQPGVALALVERIPVRLPRGEVIGLRGGDAFADQRRTGGVGVFGQIQEMKTRRAGEVTAAVAERDCDGGG